MRTVLLLSLDMFVALIYGWLAYMIFNGFLEKNDAVGMALLFLLLMFKLMRLETNIGNYE